MFNFKGKEKENTDNKEITPSEITAITVDQNSSDEQEEVKIPPITWREIKYLRRAKYDKIKDNFKKAFVLLNKRTGQIVEINAASPAHACNIIGWKARKVRILETKVLSAEETAPEVVDEKETEKV